MIEFHHVTKHYAPDGQPAALEDVSFQCHPGRVLALLGPNGSGKTTALRLSAALLRPSRGTISVRGVETCADPERVRRHIGFLTGTARLYERLTPRELVTYFARLHRLDPPSAGRRINILFDRLELGSSADRRIARLSVGLRQRVSIARALVHDPPVLVLDEPTSGLDVISARSILQLIRECRAEGKTILFSTHIMGEVSLLADDLVLLHQGRVIWSGSFPGFQESMTHRSLEDEFVARCEASERMIPAGPRE